MTPPPHPSARPTDGWLVGEPPSRPPTAPGGPEQRSARLGARMELYSRYGTLMAEAAAAVLRGDLARAEALDAERAGLAEHYEELRSAEPAAPVAFRETLADALVEADHQAAVDLSLRRELTRVAEGLRLLPAPAAADQAPDGEAGDEPAEPTVDGVVASLAGMLIDARSQGVGGALSGYFPGIAGGVGGAEVATLYAEDAGDARPGAAEGSRLDVRF